MFEIFIKALPGLLIFGGIALAIVWKVITFLWSGTDADVKAVIRYGEHDND